MIIGLFLLEDEETILTIKAKAMSNITKGTILVEWSGEGSSAKKELSMPPMDILEECNFALQSKYPETYGKRLTRSRTLIF